MENWSFFYGLANIYLHWFDKLFHRHDGPTQWAKARLVRYADDFVVLARYQGDRLTGWIEHKLEGWLGLEINLPEGCSYYRHLMNLGLKPL